MIACPSEKQQHVKRNLLPESQHWQHWHAPKLSPSPEHQPLAFSLCELPHTCPKKLKSNVYTVSKNLQ
jgi:hypothetical protein